MTSKTRITMISTVAVLIVILAGMQTMQIQNVALAVSPSDDDCELVPCWIKNTAGYWVEGSSTTIEYLYSIQYEKIFVCFLFFYLLNEMFYINQLIDYHRKFVQH